MQQEVGAQTPKTAEVIELQMAGPQQGLESSPDSSLLRNEYFPGLRLGPLSSGRMYQDKCQRRLGQSRPPAGAAVSRHMPYLPGLAGETASDLCFFNIWGKILYFKICQNSFSICNSLLPLPSHH